MHARLAISSTKRAAAANHGEIGLELRIYLAIIMLLLLARVTALKRSAPNRVPAPER